MSITGFVDGIPGLISQAVESTPLLGYVVIGAVMLLENVIPPIPSEVVMPMGGFLIQQGKLELIPTVLAGLIGTVLGAWFWYGIGRLINEEQLEHWLNRHGRWLGINTHALATSRRWFNRHGVALVFWGRAVPGLRTLISVPAGAARMPQLTFLTWTTAGSLLWMSTLTLAGLLLGAGYRQVSRALEPLGTLIGIAMAGALAWLAALMARRWLRTRVSHTNNRGNQ